MNIDIIKYYDCFGVGLTKSPPGSLLGETWPEGL